jgi:drug/metabolite transporter (DMT)-like permease
MYKGIILLLLAELCFSSATVFAKFMTQISTVSTLETTFFRFLFGVILAFFYLKKRKITFNPKKLNLVIWRGILNSASVIFFFLAVQYTTITNANMLNMTYPAFILLVAPFINKEKTSPVFIIFLILTMIGVFLVINPDFEKINIGDIFGLMSGIIAAFGISTLREASKYDNTFSILFYLMGIGTILNLIIIIPVFQIPTGLTAVYVFISAILGVIGQVFLTAGYKYISAKSGSLVSTSRIIFAMIFGVFLFSDPLSLRIIIGGVLIMISIISVTLLKNKFTVKIDSE